MVDNETLIAAFGIFQHKDSAAASDAHIAVIEGKIPTDASATNKLADKMYVNDSINASSAYFRGSFSTVADLMAVSWQTTSKSAANYVANNDYAYIEADEYHNDETWRYVYVLEDGGQSNGWKAEYKLNVELIAATVREIADLVDYANQIINPTS